MHLLQDPFFAHPEMLNEVGIGWEKKNLIILIYFQYFGIGLILAR